jgi:hypothetical protein
MNYSPLPYENLTGRIGDYWLEDGQVKYKEYGLKDVSPPESLYTSYEYVITVKVLVDPPEPLVRRLMLRQKRRSLGYLR